MYTLIHHRYDINLFKIGKGFTHTHTLSNNYDVQHIGIHTSHAYAMDKKWFVVHG